MLKLYATREQGKDILWMATFQNGLFRINLESGQIKNYMFNKWDSNFDVTDIYPAKHSLKSVLWLASYNGVYRLDTETGHYTHYYSNPQDPGGLSTNTVYSVIEDNSGIIWAATASGVNKLNLVNFFCD